MPRTTDEIITLLKGDPADKPESPDALAPTLAVITPDPDGSKPHSAQARAERRAAMLAVQPPGTATPTDRLKRTDQFAVVARLLAFNATNEEILEGLGKAGHEMSERTLQRLLKRDDFQRYYEVFQGDINRRIAKMLEEFAILAAPEAFNHLVRLMRGAKSSETERQAANDLLKYAGFGRSEGPKSLHIYLPPGMAEMLIAEGKRIASTPMKMLQRAADAPILEAEIVSEEVES